MLQARACACILIIAGACLNAVDSVARDQAGDAFGQELLIEQRLTAGLEAEKTGRFDQPDDNCAWFYYRSVLDLDPGNSAALQGLERVQAYLVARAMQQAREMDFESAERTLEDASLVLGDSDGVEQAAEQLREIRAQRAHELESAAVEAMDAGDFERAEQLLVELVALGEMSAKVSQLRRRLEESRVYGGLKPGQVIRDPFVNAPIWTPELVVVMAGSFLMGSPLSEQGRQDSESPEHRVTFRSGFALGRTEVTVQQFRIFVERTRYLTDAEKLGSSTIYDERSGRLAAREGVSWKNDYEGRPASDDDPVVHVSWNDARAYTRWLAEGTGENYRLPSEAEFEYALRGGRASRYWWGDGSPDRPVENLTGEHDQSRSRRQWSTHFEGYGDRYWGPAPVASFEPNPFGLQDIGGNVGEWVMDCWHDTYLRAPADGSAWVNPGCSMRVIRGGYWASAPDQARSAYRLSDQPERGDARVGFRIARDL